MSLQREFFNRETNITAKVICDSISEAGQRIITLEIEYPRFILAELNTHKMLEKNSSSSRAIPIKAMIEQILSNGAEPLFWGTKQSGMQAGPEPDDCIVGQFIDVWDDAKGNAISSLIDLDRLSLHKQVANRLVEPFQMMKTVITGTDWDNFFNLRIHPDAQPEFCMLAYKMYQAMQDSTPMLLYSGEYHLPYIKVDRDDKGEIMYLPYEEDRIEGWVEYSLEQAQRISASCTAQTSYRKSDDSLEKADKVFDMLINAEVIHSSPFTHLATPVEPPVDDEVNNVFPETWQDGVTHMNRRGVLCSGNLSGWISYRHLIPNNTCYDFNFEERMKLFDN